ncbi:hypothetical protein [Streptomyces sp. NPDC021622]|uniref:hypothetical protein n=1 Tax=Streptomyces sp. NPDC021622 TaxID=3155013 RepID=UPI0033DF0B4F
MLESKTTTSILVFLSSFTGPLSLATWWKYASWPLRAAGKSRIDELVEYAADDRRLPIILDTCQHLVDACALPADLLPSQAPQLKILATSRQALDIPGEYVLPVPLLGLSEGDAGGDALELFKQRAAVAVPGLRLSDGGRKAAPPRHQTLRTTTGWSHELCSPAERCCGPGFRSSPANSISPRWRPCAPTPSCPRAPRWAR